MKKVVFLLILIAAILGGWWLYHRYNSVDETEKEPVAVAKVDTVAVRKESIARTLDALGVVASSPSGERGFAAPYDCMVRAVVVSAGSRVRAGERVMEIDPTPDSKLQWDSAKSAWELAQKSWASTQERFNLKLATNQEMLAAQQTERDAELKVKSLEARGLGGDGKVLADAAGVISKLDTTPGSLIAAGALLFSVSTEQGLEVRLNIESADAALVQPGQKVALQSLNNPKNESIHATVRQVGAVLDAASGVVELRVSFPTPAALLVGEHVRGAIEIERKDSWVVPRSAVLPEGAHQFVFIAKDGKATRREVHSGISSADLVEIAEGDVLGGERVVTSGNYELSDGMAIAESEAAQPAAGKSSGEVGQ